MKEAMYRVNEVFYSIQGEGILAGRPAVFIRFSGCNLNCTRVKEGFDCDTNHTSFQKMTLADLVSQVDNLVPEPLNYERPDRQAYCVLTGGEPALQVDYDLVRAIRNRGFFIQMETNGTIELDNSIIHAISWITVSPKGLVLIQRMDEVKYVLASGQQPPSILKAQRSYAQECIQPAWCVDPRARRDNLEWCIKLVKEHNPRYQLSVQLHKHIGVR